MEDSKIKEALTFIKNAEKATKKGWFSSPDYGIAAQYYDQAANTYKSINYLKPSIENYILASDNYIKANSIFMAAKTTENAANLAIQLKEVTLASQYFETASELYMQSGSLDTGAQLLEKCSKTFETYDMEKAIQFVTKACEAYLAEDKGKFAVEGFRRLVALLIKEKRWLDANTQLLEMKKVTDTLSNASTSNKIFLSQCIIWLAYGDEIAAKKIMDAGTESRGFVGSPEHQLITQLLEFYSEGDQEAWDQLILKNVMMFLESEITRVAKQLKLPRSKKVKSSIQNSEIPTTTMSAEIPIPGDIPSKPQQDTTQEDSDDDSLC